MKKKIIEVNRDAFISWINGEPIDFSNGNGHVYDEVKYEQAGLALVCGEAVYMLNDKGECISMLIKNGDAVREYQI